MAGHEGSMLLWCLASSFWMFLASIYSKNLKESLRNNFLTVMGLLNLGFLLFVVATSNPFDRNMIVPIDGKYLNPLLQDFGLIVHPPMLYMGYVGLSVVFAFAIACCFEDDFKKRMGAMDKTLDFSILVIFNFGHSSWELVGIL